MRISVDVLATLIILSCVASASEAFNSARTEAVKTYYFSGVWPKTVRPGQIVELAFDGPASALRRAKVLWGLAELPPDTLSILAYGKWGRVLGDQNSTLHGSVARLPESELEVHYRETTGARQSVKTAVPIGAVSGWVVVHVPPASRGADIFVVNFRTAWVEVKP